MNREKPRSGSLLIVLVAAVMVGALTGCSARSPRRDLEPWSVGPGGPDYLAALDEEHDRGLFAELRGYAP